MLPFEQHLFARAGERVAFVGHPLLDRVTTARPRAETLTRHGLTPDARLLAILPGSRRAEIRYLLRPMVATACCTAITISSGNRAGAALNTVFNISSLHNPAYRGQELADGIYVDGGADVVIERNLVHNTDLGIEAASEHHGHTSDRVTVRSNIVYASNQVGISIGGYANGVGGTTNCIIVNNTLYGNGTAPQSEGEFQIQFHASDNTFMNNIAEADNSQNLLLYSFVPTPTHPATLDYNLYDAPGGADNSDWTWLNKTYSVFTRYQMATGNDAKSRFADPQFVDPATSDFQLTAGSPALDAGVLLPLSSIGLLDFAGSPRSTAQGEIDQGAYQN